MITEELLLSHVMKRARTSSMGEISRHTAKLRKSNDNPGLLAQFSRLRGVVEEMRVILGRLESLLELDNGT